MTGMDMEEAQIGQSQPSKENMLDSGKYAESERE